MSHAHYFMHLFLTFDPVNITLSPQNQHAASKINHH